MTRHALTAAAALLCAFLPTTAALAQPGPRPATLVRAGNLFDSEAGRMVGPRDILIRGDRVAEVGQGLAVPEGATVLDMSRCSVLPGLIDGHTHLLLLQQPGEGLGAVASRDRAIDGDAYRALSGAQRARSYIEAGVTAVRDLGNSGQFLDLTLKRALNENRLPGPRVYASGPGLAPQGGQVEPLSNGDPHGLVAGEYRVIAGVEDARVAVRQAIAAGADVIKVYPEATPQRTRLSVAELTAIVSEARRHGLPVAAHATSDASIREAVEAGVTSIEHAYEVSDDTLRLMASKGVWLVPTDPSLAMALEFTASWPRQPSREEIDGHLERGRDRLRRARDAGVRIAMGSDLYIPFAPGRGEGSRGTIDGYVEAGMTPAQALQTATWEAGRMIGDDGLGAVRSNAWADLIAVEGDPTQGLGALRSLRLVMKAGRVEVADAEGACGV